MSQKKVILVTGASSGIGLDTAIRLLKKDVLFTGVPDEQSFFPN